MLKGYNSMKYVKISKKLSPGMLDINPLELMIRQIG